MMLSDAAVAQLSFSVSERNAVSFLAIRKEARGQETTGAMRILLDILGRGGRRVRRRHFQDNVRNSVKGMEEEGIRIAENVLK